VILRYKMQYAEKLFGSFQFIEITKFFL